MTAEWMRCQAHGCDRVDVVRRAVPTDTTMRVIAAVWLCDQHGGVRPTYETWLRYAARLA